MVLPFLETESLICCLIEIRSLSDLKEECRSRFLTVPTVLTASFLLPSPPLLWQLRGPLRILYRELGFFLLVSALLSLQTLLVFDQISYHSSISPPFKVLLLFFVPFS